MKASELIKRLQELVEEYGDLEVHYMWSYEGGLTEEVQVNHDAWDYKNVTKYTAFEIS